MHSTTIRRGWTYMPVLGLLTAALMAGTAAPAGAAANRHDPLASAQVAPYGRVMLNATPTAASQVVTYTACDPSRSYQVARTVTSFQNLPLAGCQAVLTKNTERFVLCAGHGAIPLAFRVAPQLRIQPGVTPPCRGRDGSSVLRAIV